MKRWAWLLIGLLFCGPAFADSRIEVSSAGGGANPAGSSTEIQYRSSATALGAMAEYTYDSTNKTLDVADDALVDLHLINQSDATEGLILPQATDVSAGTAEGLIMWDTDDDKLYIGNGAGVTEIASGAGAGDITAVGDCAAGAAFGGASGTKLTSTTSDILDMGTDNFLIYQRNDAGSVTFAGKDDAGAADTVYDTTGTGAIIVGSADVTSVTVTTDGIGTAEVALPAGSIDGTEILDDTVDSGDYAADSIDNEHVNWADIDYLADEGAGVDEAYGAGWNADVGPPEKDDVYDYLHQIDTNDDGDVDNFDAAALASAETDPNVDTANEIEAILTNDAIDFGTGVVTAAGFTLAADENITLGSDTFDFDSGTSDFALSDDLNLTDTDPHLGLIDSDGDDFEIYADAHQLYITNTTDSIELLRFNSSYAAIFVNDVQIDADAKALQIGGDQDWELEYNETTDYLSVHSTLTNGTADDIGMITIAVDADSNASDDMDADQEVFEIGKGALDDGDGDFTSLFDIDEDGDVNIAGNLQSVVGVTASGTVEGATLTEGGVAVHNNDEMDASSELLAIFDDETGTGVICFATSPTFTTSILAASQADIGSTSAEFGDTFIGDGKALKMGDDQDVTLTHVADTGVQVELDDKIMFGDTAVYIHSDDDGYLDIEADTGIRMDGPVDMQANALDCDSNSVTLSTVLGDINAGGADLELPQGQTPDTDGDVDLDFTDGSLVVQHGSAHAELASSTDVVVGKLIRAFAMTLIEPDQIQTVSDTIPMRAIQSTEFPHGIVVTDIHLKTSASSSLAINVENWDDPATINGSNPTIDNIALSAATEVSEDTITYATIAAGQIVVLDLDTTDVNWAYIQCEYYEPVA